MTITSWPDRGVLSGECLLADATLSIDVTAVETPRQRDLSLGLMMSALNFFTWPTGYSYTVTIDAAAGTIHGAWGNDV